MSRLPGALTIRLAELRPVVDAVELTKGLRGGMVGGKVRSARLVPVDGGMTIELFGSSTFVPIATGALDRELSVDANLLAGFLRNSTRAFHPAEIVGLNVGPDHLIGTCGTLKVTLQLGATTASNRQHGRSTKARNATVHRSPEAESESARAEDAERSPEQPAGPAPEDEAEQNNTSAAGPTGTDANLWDAESELYRIEEIERMLKLARHPRPDYKGIRVLILGWVLLLALSEIVFGGDTLAWLVVGCTVAFIAEAWSDLSAKREWEKRRREKEMEIFEIKKRIELLGYTARQEPSCWVLQLKSEKTASDA